MIEIDIIRGSKYVSPWRGVETSVLERELV
jgi:hypothetical protein